MYLSSSIRLLKLTLTVLLIQAPQLMADEGEFRVTVTKMHLCCGACTAAVNKAVAKVDDVKVDIDADEQQASFVGKSKDAVQKALHAMAAAGFVGKLDSKEVAFKKIEVPKGQVTELAFSEVHNCCGGCSKALKDAIGKIEGVQSEDVTPKKTKFVVKGDFVAKDLTDAILGAGFYFQLKE